MEKAAEPSVAEEAVEEVPAPALDMPVEELGLSGRIVKALEDAEIDTARQLADKMGEGKDAVLAIPGLGEKSLEEIEGVLRDRGLLE
jgi:DNA-directed RNA polymerase alpha subunit